MKYVGWFRSGISQFQLLDMVEGYICIETTETTDEWRNTGGT